MSSLLHGSREENENSEITRVHSESAVRIWQRAPCRSHGWPDVKPRGLSPQRRATARTPQTCPQRTENRPSAPPEHTCSGDSRAPHRSGTPTEAQNCTLPHKDRPQRGPCARRNAVASRAFYSSSDCLAHPIGPVGPTWRRPRSGICTATRVPRGIGVGVVRNLLNVKASVTFRCLKGARNWDRTAPHA